MQVELRLIPQREPAGAHRFGDVDGRRRRLVRRQKLRNDLRRNKWAGLRRSEQAQTSPEQISLADEEYQAYVQTAYRAMIQTNPAPDKAETGDLKAKQSERTTAPASDPELKGAAGLMKRPVSTPDVPATDMEQALLATIPLTNDDLNQLAQERARRTQEKILASGKIEATRISLKASDAGDSSKPAARVYFHLE